MAEIYQDEGDRGDLFKNLYFLLKREVPQELIEFIIFSCVGNASRLQFTKNENDKCFTHHVVDRIVDSLNAGVLLPTRKQ